MSFCLSPCVFFILLQMLSAISQDFHWWIQVRSYMVWYHTISVAAAAILYWTLTVFKLTIAKFSCAYGANSQKLLYFASSALKTRFFAASAPALQLNRPRPQLARWHISWVDRYMGVFTNLVNLNASHSIEFRPPLKKDGSQHVGTSAGPSRQWAARRYISWVDRDHS